MRWLLVHPGPSFSVHDVFEGWREALTDLGEHVAVFNLDNRLQFYDSLLMDMGHKDETTGHQFVRKALTHDQAIELAANGLLSAAYQFWPDIILGVSAFFTPPPLLDIMRARGHKIVLVHTESPYQDGEQLLRAAHADINLVNDPVSLDAFRDLGPAEYVPHAYRPSLHKPGPAVADMVSDLAFVGTGYQSRVEFFERMNLDGLNVLLAGNWLPLDTMPDSPLHGYLAHDMGDCLDNEQTVDVYRSARSGINFYRRESDNDAVTGVAMGPREIEMAAAGLFFLRDPRPEGDALLPMLPTFASPEDAGEQLRWWLGHDTQREQAAQAACAAVIDRTFSSNARMLLRLLDRQPVTIS